MEAAAAPTTPADVSARLSASRCVREQVQALNEAVGAAARRAFGLRSLSARSPPAAIRSQLPELSRFVASIGAFGDEKRSRKGAESALAVFGDPRALWLSRSARESGVSALLARLLVEDAVESGGGNAVEFVARVFFDALLTSCSVRLGGHCKACEWRHRRPKYPAMPCALVWSTLLPFVEMLARLWPNAIGQVLEQYYAVLRPQRMHVNCVFAQVTGFWMLLERLNGVVGDDVSASLRSALPESNPKDSLQLMQQILRFMVRGKILGDNQPTGDPHVSSQGSDFDDLLMEKFFSNMRDFSFTCTRSSEVVGPALLSALRDGFERLPTNEEAWKGLFASKMAILTASSCLISSKMAQQILPALFNARQVQSLQQDSFPKESQLLQLAVGVASHVDLVDLDSLLKLLVYLLDRHARCKEINFEDFSSLYYIIYTAVHRRGTLRAHNADGVLSSRASTVQVQLLKFQERVLSIDPLAFHLVPIKFMRIFWLDWMDLSDEDVESFQHFCEQATKDDGPADYLDALQWESLTTLLPLRSLDSGFFNMSARLQSHWIPPVELELSVGIKRPRDNGTGQGGRITKRTATNLNQEQTERVMNVLLLPEMTERICSFMSAKRLCRIASVCKVFAEVSRRDTLWSGLWVSLTAKESKPVVCTHGPGFQHNWLDMYRARSKSWRKVRRLQKQAKTKHLENDNGNWHNTGSPDRDLNETSPFPPHICEYCDCNIVLTSKLQANDHALLHKTHRCKYLDCGASLSSAGKLDLHIKKCHRTKRQECKEPKQKTRVACGFEGCKKTYVSMKRLETHRKKHNHSLGDDVGVQVGDIKDVDIKSENMDI